MVANAAQRENWQSIAGPKWLHNEAALAASHQAIAAELQAAAQARPGETVLEIGCGTGTSLSRWATAVAPGGHVTGLDIAGTMLARARERAPAGVTLIEADAQTIRFDPAFDLVVSQFGLMFFDDPPAAFANIRTAMRPRGRLCFVCWAPLAANLHWRLPLEIATRHLGPPTPRPPHAPGPLALADAVYLQALLRRAGFGKVHLHTASPLLPSGSLADAVAIAMSMGPAGALIRERDPADAVLAVIRKDVTEAFQPYLNDAIVHLPAGIHIVTAYA